MDPNSIIIWNMFAKVSFIMIAESSRMMTVKKKDRGESICKSREYLLCGQGCKLDDNPVCQSKQTNNERYVRRRASSMENTRVKIPPWIFQSGAVPQRHLYAWRKKREKIRQRTKQEKMRERETHGKYKCRFESTVVETGKWLSTTSPAAPSI